MAKKNKHKKPVKRRKPKKMDVLDYIALVIFIVIGIGIVAGSIWYYLFHLPAAKEEMTDVSVEFTYAFFDFGVGEFSGQEALQLMTRERANLFQRGLEDLQRTYQIRGVESRVESDVEVEVVDQGYNSGTTRVIFWQFEEDIDKGPRTLLMLYTYEFKRQDGRWLVDRIVTATQKELEQLRRERGVLDENGEEDNDNGQQENGDENGDGGENSDDDED